MSALTSPVLINQNRAYWLSSIQNDVTHSTITAQEIDTNLARFSTVYVSDFLTTSTLNASSFTLTNLDLSNAEISTLKTNNAYTSSLTWASDLSGGSGSVFITTDPSGVKVSGDPIVFGNLVYFTSTINLVPVSTIVDTDIFSSNAYFSTMSSGTISAGQIQANTASLSTLFVSSITTTDISGFSPTTWSLYPTLNSSITFNGPNVLSNIGNKLYFAGNEITDLSGGGANWSAFPATQDVSMNNFSIRALSTLQYQDGAKLYSLTGNNLFYNNQQIYSGNQGNTAMWSFYPASTTINTAGYPIATTGNLPISVGSNLTMLAGRVSTVIDQGVNIATNAQYDLTVQNGNRGVINLTANGGFNNGIYGTINLTANGATLGGVGSGGLINITANTPIGTPCNATSAVKISASGINSYAGAIPSIGSLAGYNFIYGTAGVNIATGLPTAFPNIPLTTYLYGTAGVTTSSDFYVPTIQPYWNGLTTPPDLIIQGRYIVPNLAQVYVQLSNVKVINMDTPNGTINNLRILNMSNSGGALSNVSSINGQNINTFANQSNILASNVTATISVNTAVVNTQSTITNTLYTSQQAQISTVLWSFALGISSVFNNIAVNNIKIADDLTGVTNAPNPNQSRLLNFSTVNSFNVSTTDLWVSSINGQPIDISGNPFVNTNNFSTLFTSTLQVSSITIPPGQQAITVQNPLRFATSGTIERCFQINTDQTLNLTLNCGTLGTSAFNTTMASISTGNIATSNLKVSSIQASPSTVGVLTIDGQVEPTNQIIINNGNAIRFKDTTGSVPMYLENQPLASVDMPCFVNSYGSFSNNLGAVGANALYLGGGYGAFASAKFYSEFPGTAFGLDIIDADGTDLFEAMYCYDTGGFNFQTGLFGVSSITGWTANTPGASSALGIGADFLTAPCISTPSLLVSSINGGTLNTINISSLNFSTATSVGSNANFNYPLTIDYDQAGSANAGVAIAVQGHSFGTGAVINRIEMGARGSGENYIMSVWPGHNLEELFIDATDVTIRDGVFSTIINLDPFGLQTTGGIKGPFMSTLDLNVSSINNLDANKAYTNNIQTSTMELYAGSTTLMYWDSVTTDLNINTSGYDAVVGLNGTFKIGASFQFISPGAADEVEFFILKNDAVISQAGGICEVANNAEIIQYFESVETLANGDKIQIGCYTANSNVYLSTINGTVIQSPAVILTMYKVD